MKFLKFLLKLTGLLLAIAGAAYMIVTYLDQIRALFGKACERIHECCDCAKSKEYEDYAD